jgi:hypothetical protein
VSALIQANRYQMAGLSAISIIPVVGDAIGKSGKVALKAVR